MSDAAPLSEDEARDFAELGLTPGYWAALAPVPLLRFRTWRVSNPDDVKSFRALAAFMPEEPGRPGEPEEFWARVAEAGPPEAAQRLFRGHLAGLPEAVRAEYLRTLDEIAGALFPGLLKDAGDGPGRWAREAVEPAPRGDTAVTPEAPPAGPSPTEPGPPEPPRPVPEVVTATDFEPLTFAEAIRRSRRPTVAAVRDWLADPANASRLLFDAFRTDSPEVAIVTDPGAVPRALWVVGDLHADVLALANIIEYARRNTPDEDGPPAFLFLGDFVDRGRHDHETLLLVFDLVVQNPGRVCVIPGNHDIDLRWGEKSRRFGVTIQPAEYCEHLNTLVESERPADRERVELAKLAIEFWKGRPKAVFLPDGTAYSHGGFPHTDTHDALKTRADLGSKRCVDDFLWARLSESPKKRPNRGSRGHEFGWRDFEQFCRLGAGQLGLPVRRLVRGHDHVSGRWLMPAEYREHPVLTVNAMGWRLEGEPEPAGGPHPFPVVARHVPGELPRVVRLPLDPAEVERAFAEPDPADELPSWLEDFPGGPSIEDQVTPRQAPRSPDAPQPGGGM